MLVFDCPKNNWPLTKRGALLYLENTFVLIVTFAAAVKRPSSSSLKGHYKFWCDMALKSVGLSLDYMRIPKGGFVVN